MTGFGRGTASGENFSITVELKTVNNRFLDVNLRLSNELQPLETRVKHLIGERLSRGRVEVNVQYDRTDEITYELNRAMISGYLAAMRQMQQEFSLTGEPDLNVIARLPNVVMPKKEDMDPAFVAGIESALSAALDDLKKMREKEGELLKSELSALVHGIETRLPAIESESANVAEEYRQRLTKKIGEMLAKSESQIEMDQARLAQEIAYLADRSDISEEITRLRTHLGHFRSILEDENDVGKRLDFLTQELNREANTITSKTSNMVVKENALQIKSDIEKIREQVQNIE